MNEDSTREESVRVNWTFDEAAQVAEHLKHDLQLDRVLFLMGGWIRRGYDNQHPDILPSAPECGGDAAFADAARRIRATGYLFGLHDNYQDIYRDSPSWSEDWIMKQPDGALVKGGHWAGGRAHLTCSQKALELAQRPQNLPAVRALTSADAYFIDTTYASGLLECFDLKHPLNRTDDLHWKQEISSYARDVFGIFGSECGREWGIPHSDFFEGLTGVSGTYYHDTALLKKLGAVVVPLFEIVYRDTMAMYGKYGYDIHRSSEYVLHHISLGRPLHYHNVPPHLYWQTSGPPDTDLSLRPRIIRAESTGPRRCAITYGWEVEKTPAADWRVFVHFTDRSGKILFQGDYAPQSPISGWAPGRREDDPFEIQVPADITGTVIVRMGLFNPSSGERASLAGRDDGERRYTVGRLSISGEQVSFELPADSEDAPSADAGRYARAEGGWAAGLHPFDRFVKNTHEILSPLHALTAEMKMTRHEFLDDARRVRRTVFGEGRDAIATLVNLGDQPLDQTSRFGGRVTIPPGGFLVEGPTFAAFCLTRWNGVAYEAPPLFTLRSEDGKRLDRSRAIRVFHGFGDPRIRVRETMAEVSREELVRLP
jgi:hypothetical protein